MACDCARSSARFVTIGGISLSVGGKDFAIVLKRGNSNGSALTGVLGNLGGPANNSVFIRNVGAGSRRARLLVGGGINVIFRGPSGRLITSVIRRSITFNPRGLKLRPRIVHRHISRTLGSINVCRFGSSAPRRLSNKRGREVTVTNVVTLRPRYLILSRPATVLSPGKHTRVVGAILHLGGRGNVAIILVARCVRRTRGSSEILIVGSNGFVTSNAPGRVFEGIGVLGSIKLSIPRAARLLCTLGRGSVSIPASILKMRRATSMVVHCVRSGGWVIDFANGGPGPRL